MNLRTTLILVLILAGLGAYAYFIEYKGTEKKKEEEEQQKVLFEVKKENIAEISFQTDSQTVRVVPAGQDRWQMTSPMKARADAGTVDRILSAVEKLKYEEIVEEAPKDLSEYGLAQPKSTIELKLKDKGARQLLIGERNPIENEFYLKVGNDPRVYLVDSGVGELSNITLFDFRDKQLTDFDSDKVTAVSVMTGAESNLQFQKEGDAWKMTQPVMSPASDTEVTSLLSSLENLNASRFVDNPGDHTQFGLQNAKTAIELQLEKGLKQRILFGNKEANDIYVLVEGSNQIAAVSDTFTTLFERDVEEWREKKLVNFNRFDVEELRLKTGGKEYAFSRGENEDWSQTAPAKAQVESEKIQEILEKLENAEILGYGQQNALSSPPVLEVFMTTRDWQEKTGKKHLMFGAADGENQPVKNADYPTLVMTPAELQQEIAKAVTEVKPKAPQTKPQAKK